MIEIQIHEDSCRGCEMCVDVCPTDVLVMDEARGKAVVKTAADCIGCLSCGYLCPSAAITHEGYLAVKNYYRDIDFSRRVARFL